MNPNSKQRTLSVFSELDVNKFFALRIKHVQSLELQRTLTFFSDKCKYVLVSMEEGKGKEGTHIHGLISGEFETTAQVVRTWIKELYPDAKGNKCLYVSLVKNVKQTSKYTLKEGKFLYKGFNQPYIRTMLACSNKKESIAAKIAQNEENLLSGAIFFETFVINYLIIKVEHGQNIYDSHIMAYCNRLRLKSGETSYEVYAQRFIHPK